MTNSDWDDIIKLLTWEGWILVELTYRTPIRDAFKQISEADFIFSYDGMWHYIARNFGKPMFIPSWEGITYYNTPQAVTRPTKEGVFEFISDGAYGFESSLTEMKDNAYEYIGMLKEKYHEG